MSTFKNAIDGIDLGKAPKDSYIIEIGSVREKSEMPSSLYLSKKAKTNGLKFITVDFSKESWLCAKSYVGEEAKLSDGSEFLCNFNGKIYLLFLDSFDYPFNERLVWNFITRGINKVYEEKSEPLTKERSAQVHLNQYMDALGKMTTPCWIVIDDTLRPRSMIRRIRSPFIGKGELILPKTLQDGFIIKEEYNKGIVLYRDGKKHSKFLYWLQMCFGQVRLKFLYKITLCAWCRPEVTAIEIGVTICMVPINNSDPSPLPRDRIAVVGSLMSGNNVAAHKFYGERQDVPV